MVEVSPSVVVPGRRLGARPPTGAPALLAARYMKAKVPAHPQDVDHLSTPRFGLDKNDQFGTCGPTALDNLRRMVTLGLTGQQRDATWEDVKALYMHQNPDFDEATGAGDNGVVLQDMLGDAVKYGFAGEPVLGFAKVDLADDELVRAAVDIFGGLILGLDLQVAQQHQFDAGEWDYQPSAPWGGHAILEGAYRSSPRREGGISWERPVEMTDSFLTHQRTEAWVVIFPAHLDSRKFFDSVDLASFVRDYRDITGRPFLPPGGADRVTFQVSFSADQAAKIRARAARRGISPESWIEGRVGSALR